MQDDSDDLALFKGLTQLSESAFPKTCSYCGRHFETVEDFVRETEKLQGGSGLKASVDDDERPLVELYRNCACGSTLMDFFTDRRDSSQRVLKRRLHFDKVLAILERRGIPPAQARAELLKLIRGEPSEVIENLRRGNRNQALD